MADAFKKIMLVTNDPCDTDGAEKTTAFLAKSNSADVLLVDTLKTPFYPTQGPALSTEFAYEIALKSKDAYLEKVKAKLEEIGIAAASKVLCSPRTSSELVSTAIEEECDLVVRYMKGKSSRAQGRFGETAQNLMRACPVPVLFAQDPVENPKVLACINLDHGPDENKVIIENAQRMVSSLENLFVLCCWEFSGNDFLFDYMDEGMSKQTREETASMYSKLFDRLKADYGLGELGERVCLLNKNPVEGIPDFCTSNSIDLSVMCSASLHHPLGRKLGTTIERTIADLPTALLTVKPTGFSTPRVVETKVAQSV